MLRVLFEIPGLGLQIFGYGFMLCIALFACTKLAARYAAQNGQSEDLIYDLSLPFLLIGIFGARLFWIIQKRDQVSHPLWEFFQIWHGGLVVYGGFLGSMLATVWFARSRRLKLLWLLDVLAPSMALGLAIGRIGCLLNGCCFGGY